MKGYSHESCLTESAAGGILLYISNNLSYKPKNDLCIYKSTKLESTFIEILNPKKTNVIVGCIYRHPHMDLNNLVTTTSIIYWISYQRKIKLFSF